MLFHTFSFFIFYICFIAVYYSFKTQKFRVVCILAFSNLFYGWWNWKLLSLIWLTIFLDYSISKKIYSEDCKNRKLMYLLITIFVNFGLLGFFKYWNFFIDIAISLGINSSDKLLIQGLILPVGISFYTFQSISYSIDIYRNKYEPVRSIIEYASFVSFFPQLVAGPIERLDHLLPQIKKKIPFSIQNFNEGIWLFSHGFLRKGLADVYSEVSDPIFNNIKFSNANDVFYSMIYFTFQIYLDFSGYTLMARGIAKSIGIDLSLNFKSPYFSLSIREFWTRWHISLSSWLKEYLYFSLGGSKTHIVYIFRNLLITMVLGGLWHGAGLNFLIWGLLHGVYLCVNHLFIYLKFPFRRLVYKITGRSLASIITIPQYRLICWLVTFCLVSYTWLYFRIPKFEDIIIANKAVLAFLKNPSVSPNFTRMAILFLPIILIDLWEQKNNYKHHFSSFNLKQYIIYGIFSGLIFILGLIFIVGKPTSQFIYFQF